MIEAIPDLWVSEGNCKKLLTESQTNKCENKNDAVQGFHVYVPKTSPKANQK